jgi:predicted nucleic acid-binding protein
MAVLIDTSVWSRALRSNFRKGERRVITRLIQDFEGAMIGPIRQEALSGMRHKAQFEKAREKLRAFPDLPLTIAVHELAAEYVNHCRAHGVQGSQVDFMICAAAIHYDLEVYTVDQDFQAFAQLLPLKLHQTA